eukprot:1153231-Pelagomonas_calceolata.AAC.12
MANKGTFKVLQQGKEPAPAGGGGGAASDVGLAAASNLPPLTDLAAAEKEWLEVLTTTDRFFQVRIVVRKRQTQVLEGADHQCQISQSSTGLNCAQPSQRLLQVPGSTPLTGSGPGRYLEVRSTVMQHTFLMVLAPLPGSRAALMLSL